MCQTFQHLQVLWITWFPPGLGILRLTFQSQGPVCFRSPAQVLTPSSASSHRHCMQAYTSEQKCLRPHKDYKRQIPKLWLWFELFPRPCGLVVGVSVSCIHICFPLFTDLLIRSRMPSQRVTLNVPDLPAPASALDNVVSSWSGHPSSNISVTGASVPPFSGSGVDALFRFLPSSPMLLCSYVVPVDRDE